ncbi:phosphopantetheine-binding protein [Streptomyces sp. ASQP_92]|uniref:phosphopantetheine-binding protein n=1 Tax=unclassified Streptomyces TaxID=2593676 RepID=UPI0021BFD94C|nr:phosphopantetheine-binding protein [Streptomyces sp. ASQP_92]MCT9089948.1 phosphopantetheine-binding protein [Streptomyces sp. ASQP_92]
MQTQTSTQEELEQWVLTTCRDLGLEVETADDDFFEAGGTSLTAIRLIAQAEEAYGEDALTPDDLFARSAVRDIAASMLQNDRD